MDIRLNIRPTGKLKSKGQVYEVLFEGDVIATGTSPEFAACRVLKERGLTGHATFYREGKLTWDLRMGIAWGAARTLTEHQKGMAIVKWEPGTWFKKPDEEIEEAA